MEFDTEITEKLNSIRAEKDELNSRLHTVTTKEHDLQNFINQCAVFDGSIIFYISQLLSHKEGNAYAPIIYKKYRKCGCYPPSYAEDTYIGISTEENVINFIRTGSENVDIFLNLKLGYEIFQKSVGPITEFGYDTGGWIINYYNYCDYEKDDKKMITFGFILNNYGIRNSLPAVYSRYNFQDYPYVQDFIIHLFNLQVQNNGRTLKSGEIIQALNNFLDLEEEMSRNNTPAKTKGK